MGALNAAAAAGAAPPNALVEAARPLLGFALAEADGPGAGYRVERGALADPDGVARLCAAAMESRPPDEIMMREGEPYAERWYLLRSGGADSGPNLYLHRFLVDDDPVLHDHPWASASWMVGGGIAETWAPDGASPARNEERLRPGDLVVRSAAHAHQLRILGAARPVTLFATARKVREWGFWPGGRFVPWQEYVRGRAEGPSVVPA